MPPNLQPGTSFPLRYFARHFGSPMKWENLAPAIRSLFVESGPGAISGEFFIAEGEMTGRQFLITAILLEKLHQVRGDVLLVQNGELAFLIRLARKAGPVTGVTAILTSSIIQAEFSQDHGRRKQG